MIGVAALIIAAGPAFIQQQGTRFSGPNTEILIWPANKITISSFGEGAFTVEGDPATIQWKDAGLNFTANVMTGSLGVEPEKGYFVKNASFTGQSEISYDSARIAAFLSERSGSPAPSGEGIMRMSVKGDSLAYVGEFATGEIQLHAPFEANWSMNGGTVSPGNPLATAGAFAGTFSLAGSSGTIGISTHVPAGELPLRKGNISGPVSFHFLRTPIANGKQEDATEVRGDADRMEFDFVGATHTVSLMGNVRIMGTQGPYAGSTAGDRVVFTFGADNQLQTITVEGKPSESNFKPRPKPGGGR